MKITKATIENGLKNNAKSKAFFDLKEEMDLVLPISKFYEMVKSKATVYLTVAGVVSSELVKGSLTKEQVKTFVKMSAQEPELVSGFWASLPSVIQFLNEKAEREEGKKPEHKKLWYGENLPAFVAERNAVTFLMSQMTEEELDVISDAALKANTEFQERKDKQREEIKAAAAIFEEAQND